MKKTLHSIICATALGLFSSYTIAMDSSSQPDPIFEWILSHTQDDYCGHAKKIDQLVISHDGTLAVSAEKIPEGESICVWSIPGKKCIWTSHVPTEIRRIFFCGEYLAVIAHNSIIFFNKTTGDIAQHFNLPFPVDKMLCISNDGKTIAWRCGSDGSWIHESYIITDTYPFSSCRFLSGNPARPARWYSFSPDGHYFITATLDTIYAWDLANKNNQNPAHSVRIASGFKHPIHISADSKFLAAMDTSNNLNIINLETWTNCHIPNIPENLSCIAIYNNQCILSWRNTLTAFAIPNTHASEAVNVRFPSNIKSISSDKNVLLVTTETGSYLLPMPLQAHSECFSFNSNRSQLMVSHGECNVLNYDKVAMLTGNSFSVTSLRKLQKILTSYEGLRATNFEFLNRLKEMSLYEECIDLRTNSRDTQELASLPKEIITALLKKMIVLLPLTSSPTPYYDDCVHIATIDRQFMIPHTLAKRLNAVLKEKPYDHMNPQVSTAELKTLLPLIPDLAKHRLTGIPPNLHAKIRSYPTEAQQILHRISAPERLNIRHLHSHMELQRFLRS